MNLDRFSQPLHGEKSKVVCTCEQCDADIYEGQETFKSDDGFYCDRNCFIDWCIDTLNGREEEA